MEFVSREVAPPHMAQQKPGSHCYLNRSPSSSRRSMLAAKSGRRRRDLRLARTVEHCRLDPGPKASDTRSDARWLQRLVVDYPTGVAERDHAGRLHPRRAPTQLLTRFVQRAASPPRRPPSPATLRECASFRRRPPRSSERVRRIAAWVRIPADKRAGRVTLAWIVRLVEKP